MSCKVLTAGSIAHFQDILHQIQSELWESVIGVGEDI